ncbi:hypothetical protein IV203_035623 [Nitzschia inconspicua]|uniref:Uncharacterized protein n=1 Tax=Nitzschia inconspicua TaxID=303405 RepID=A0A9K3PXB3_9STRA|nr:hypothetical protein IV203_035623 [Nitzschia inconspicua]
MNRVLRELTEPYNILDRHRPRPNPGQRTINSFEPTLRLDKQSLSYREKNCHHGVCQGTAPRVESSPGTTMWPTSYHGKIMEDSEMDADSNSLSVVFFAAKARTFQGS